MELLGETRMFLWGYVNIHRNVLARVIRFQSLLSVVYLWLY